MILGFALAFVQFPGRWLVTNLVQTLQSIPTVVVGLLAYLLLTRNGALGDLRWLFTQKGMILGQMMICAPVLIAMSMPPSPVSTAAPGKPAALWAPVGPRPSGWFAAS